MRRLEGRRCRVVVAMSGGVDSSVVAGLLAEAGHEVIGVTMKLYDHTRAAPEGADAEVDEAPGGGTCCSLDDVADARRVAEHLGIPFYVGNYEQAFHKAVVDDFVTSYLAGRTPNPCVRCNDVVKFRSLLARARALGADYLATGHYARTEVAPDGRVALFEGVDPGKDQSYFLAGISAAALERVVFPLGGLVKADVRAHAERLGLPVASKPDSQEICFIPNGDYARFIEGAAGDRVPRPGAMVSLDGTRLGQHRGLHHYTVGQRKGLGLPGPDPHYVVALRPEDGALVVGGRDDVLAAGLTASNPKWLGDPPADGAVVRARIRHRHAGSPGVVRHAEGGLVEVWFDAPIAAVTPGQQVALYDGPRVLGAATIEGPLRRRAPLAAEALHG